MKRQGSGGFTLIELLVVISIIAILAAIILPALGLVKRKANITKDRSNIAGIGKGLMLYADEYNKFPKETTPALSVKQLVVKGYTPDPKIYDCPALQNLTGPQLQDTGDTAGTKMYNQYFYTFACADKLRTDIQNVFIIGDDDAAWAAIPDPVVIVGKCDGTTVDLKKSDFDDIGGVADTSAMYNPYQKTPQDNLFKNDNIAGGLETFLVVATDDWTAAP